MPSTPDALPPVTAPLSRLDPFEGLCLTAQDLRDEQVYHRMSLHRHNVYLHGHGIVQGLQVDLDPPKQGYQMATLQPGYGLTRMGQGVLLPDTARLKLPVPKQDGMYMLWLFYVEGPDDESERPVFDTSEVRPSRTIERRAARLHPVDEDQPDAVALCRIKVRMGGMSQVMMPVPRAGLHARAAESYLKPHVSKFIRLSKSVLSNLFRTALVRDLDLGALNFSSALVSAEFLLIEEGTSDRVLYRVAGNLIEYAHSYYNALPPTTKQIERFTEYIRRSNEGIPVPDQGDEVWLAWFEKFERLLTPLQKIVDELEQTIDPNRR